MTTRRQFLATAGITAGAGTVLLAEPAWAPPKKPVVTTGAASLVTQTTARLNGTVNPKGSATTYHFDYGPTTAYGQVTPTGSAGSGNTAVPVSADLAGLTAGQTYHFRVQATNTGGTTLGADQTFTTLPAAGDVYGDLYEDGY